MANPNDTGPQILFMPPHRRRAPEARGADTFAERLIRLRKERGLSQVQLAAKLGIAQPNLSGYERGETKPGFDVLFDLARVLKVSSDELLGLERSEPQHVVNDRRLIQQMQVIERLPKRDKEALIRTIKLCIGRSSTSSRSNE